jgi:hypothetical protein
MSLPIVSSHACALSTAPLPSPNIAKMWVHWSPVGGGFGSGIGLGGGFPPLKTKQGLTTCGKPRVSPTLKQTHSRYEVEQPTRPFHSNTQPMAPARGRATARKPKSKKKKAQEPSASPERSPVRDSEYEVQRKARLAQNADCLSSLEVAKIPARAQATKRNRRTRCAHVNVRSFAVASIRREVCLRAQVAA